MTAKLRIEMLTSLPSDRFFRAHGFGAEPPLTGASHHMAF
jgi:hypothetical protein